MTNGINKLAQEVHQNAVNKGFFEDEKNIGEILCLIHSEVSEALEADRKGRYADTLYLHEMEAGKFTWENSPISYAKVFEGSIKNTFEDELADIMIRVMDLAAYRGIDLEFHIRHKMAYNKTRPHKHGKKY